MTDVVSGAIAASARPSMWGPLLSFGAGIATCAGPCVAPRFVAMASLASSGTLRWKVYMAFAAGLALGYVVVGSVAGLLAAVASFSRVTYIAAAGILALCGLRALCISPAHTCGSRTGVRPAAAFLWGSSFVAMASPCCTPVVALLGAYASSSGSLWYGAILIAAFAAGHALPLAIAGVTQRLVTIPIERLAPMRALETVSGALMLALAGYYGVLA